MTRHDPPNDPGATARGGSGLTTGPAWNRDVAASYDRVAAAYTEAFSDELSRKPFDRERLDLFSEAVRGRGLVADVGCGPGHVGRYLRERGCEVVGLDISHNMLKHGRRVSPGVRLVLGDFFSLPFRTDRLAATVAFYSLIHCTRDEVVRALREVKRVLRPGAPLLMAVHGGTGELHADAFLGQEVSVDATLFEPEEVARYLRAAGFRGEYVDFRGPYEFEFQSQRIYASATA